MFLDAPSRLRITGPREITPGETQEYECSSDASSPGVELSWKVNGDLVSEGVETTTEMIDGSTVTRSSLLLSVDSSSTQATIVCFVPGQALELHTQKLVKISGTHAGNLNFKTFIL